MPRIHVFGASGSGKTTLGAALADRLQVPHADSDTVYWMPTEPPFTTPRPVAERMPLLLRHISLAGDWVFSGSAISWAMPLEPFSELIVFLRLDPALRLERLRRREAARYGARVATGGDLVAASAGFLAWAAGYDTATERFSLAGHEAWLAAQPAPVLRLDSSPPVDALVTAVLADLRARR